MKIYHVSHRFFGEGRIIEESVSWCLWEFYRGGIR